MFSKVEPTTSMTGPRCECGGSCGNGERKQGGGDSRDNREKIRRRIERKSAEDMQVEYESGRDIKKLKTQFSKKNECVETSLFKRICDKNTFQKYIETKHSFSTNKKYLHEKSRGLSSHNHLVGLASHANGPAT
jgi:hypothetical protein